MPQIPLPPEVRLEQPAGTLPYLQVRSAAAQARIYLHGAHLAHWQPAGQAPVLWMSRSSWFAPDKPLRGGVPVCFPWFGPKADAPAAPVHGFARVLPWELAQAQVDAQGRVLLTLELRTSPATRAHWPHDFKARMQFTIGQALDMALTVENSATADLSFEQALHTYFAVGDVHQVSVTGLAGATYVDKTDHFQRKVQEDAPIRIAAETDRLYLNTAATVTLTDPGLKRSISVSKTGSHSTVVWNPWVAKSKAMPDFGDDEWPGMICVETVNAADNRVTLAPGRAHTMSALLSTAPLP